MGNLQPVPTENYRPLSDWIFISFSYLFFSYVCILPDKTYEFVGLTLTIDLSDPNHNIKRKRQFPTIRHRFACGALVGYKSIPNHPRRFRFTYRRLGFFGGGKSFGKGFICAEKSVEKWSTRFGAVLARRILLLVDYAFLRLVSD